MHPRSNTFQVILKAVLAHADDGIDFELLTNIAAAHVEEQRAIKYRLSRLKRNLNETAADTQYKGQKQIARKYIDAAHRSGRITYLDRGNKRLVFLGTPSTTGGRHAQPRTWEDEKASLPT